MKASSLNPLEEITPKLKLKALLICACAVLQTLPVIGLTIVPTFDSTITSDPQGAAIEATINSAIAFYEARFSDPITVRFTFSKMTSGLGQSSLSLGTYSYSSYRAALLSHLTSADDATALSQLPNTAGNPVNGSTNMQMALPLARALGLASDNGATDDSIGLNTTICNLSAAETNANNYSLFTVVCHEMDEGLGVFSTLDGLTNGAPAPTGAVAPEDLFRYTSTGARSFDTSLATAAYFSLDGVKLLARFNQHDHADFNDWYSPGGQIPQVQDAYGTPGSAPIPVVELRVLDAIGYTRSPGTTWAQYGQSDSGDGSYARPFNTLAAATNAVPVGGTIVLKYPGSSPERLKIAKPMLVNSWGGGARIGSAVNPSPAFDPSETRPNNSLSASGLLYTGTADNDSAAFGENRSLATVNLVYRVRN
jgi:hypothetical protein